jgi:hypothetical protein
MLYNPKRLKKLTRRVKIETEKSNKIIKLEQLM